MAARLARLGRPVPGTREAERRAEIVRGLEPPREARAIGHGERIHVVGAGGAGASAAALLAHHAGARVSGCDAGGPTPYTAAIAAAAIPMAWSHDAAHVTGDAAGGDHGAIVDRLAVTKALTSIDPDHAELSAARQRHVPVEAWQQLIADAARTHGGRLVAVAGTHGKSTSTGWLVHLLTVAGRDPAAFVGALLPGALTGGQPATARWGRGDAFVVEADEYAGNFDAYRPSIAVLLNAEWDHPDVFADEAAVIDAMEAWVRSSPAGDLPPALVANAGDPGVQRVLARLADWPGQLLAVALVDVGSSRAESYMKGLRDTYPTALGPAAALLGRLVRDGTRTTLELRGLGGPDRPDSVIRATLQLHGAHNAQNALGVAGAAALLGVPADAIGAGLSSFPGVGRRLELKGDVGGVVVLDDYGHHPTAIAATMAAVRDRYPGRRLWAVYEPLTFHRTAALLDGFADVLSTADQTLVADIWAGRDPDTTIASAAQLAGAIAARGRAPASASGSVEETADRLASEVRRGDVVLVLGGGRSYVIAERLVEALAGRADATR